MPRIVCISDTHNLNEQIPVPDGDILIHSGDASIRGTEDEIVEFFAWFSQLPHKRKVFVAGNHDWMFQLENRRARMLAIEWGITYLEDSSVDLDGLRIYGSPWQPRFFDWAFNLMRGAELAEKWALIPNEIDIVITHGPPNGILDAVQRDWGIDYTGCEELRKRVEEIAGFGRLKLHVFGHIHCGYGVYQGFGVKFVNASVCDEQYNPSQPPIVIDL